MAAALATNLCENVSLKRYTNALTRSIRASARHLKEVTYKDDSGEEHTLRQKEIGALLGQHITLRKVVAARKLEAISKRAQEFYDGDGDKKHILTHLLLVHADELYPDAAHH